MTYRYTIVVPNPKDITGEPEYFEVFGAPKLAEKSDRLQINGLSYTVTETLYDISNDIYYVWIK